MSETGYDKITGEPVEILTRDQVWASPVVRSLCDNCKDPGHCCRSIFLRRDGEPACTPETRLEAFVWMATVGHYDPWMGDIGLPVMPEYKDEDGNWRMSCPNLSPEGRCNDYENRPYLCRIYLPSVDQPCAMSLAT